MSATVLMVAEKPSLSESIARHLSHGRHVTRRTASRACPVHEWHGPFQGRQAKIKMTCVTGHVFSTDFTPRYQNWQTTEEITLFRGETMKKENNTTGVVRNLQVESKGCDYLVLWLDCDREGENICFEVIGIVERNLRGGMANIYRAKFSAITASDLQRAFNTLGRPDENQSLSVDARQELDLKVGVAFTRFQTKYFQGKYGDLDASVVSYGPCQTPTLGFTVQRHDEIQDFKPEPYWRLAPTGNKRGHSFPLEWDRGRVFDHPLAQLLFRSVEGATHAYVVSVSSKRESRPRPGAMNTVEMLKMASQKLGIGPHQAMIIAEQLYTSGYVSYPRTESTAYHDSFDLRGALQPLQRSPNWGDFVTSVLQEGLTRPKSGVDMGDHPPITPMRNATENELEGDRWRVYELITRHFIATVSPDCKYLKTRASLRVGTELFTASGKVMESPGFMAVLPWSAFKDDRLPELEQGEEIPLTGIQLKEGTTQPPDYLTESELITLMEKNGIGTDASIPTHINNICERNYAAIKSGRTVVPTKLGVILVHGYHKIDSELVLPEVRSHIEREVNRIALGQATLEYVVNSTLDVFQRKFEYFIKKIDLMDSLMEASFSQLSQTGQFLTRCGRCNRYMRHIAARPQRLYCPNCDDTYNLPAGGSIKQYKGYKCPLDQFELVIYKAGQDNKSYVVCPCCYNESPFPEVRRAMSCNLCVHPTCTHSMVNNKVCGCQDPACPGFLVIDPISAPKWKMDCNVCNRIVKLPENTHKASVNPEIVCDDCGSNMLLMEWHKDKSPLTNGATSYNGCVLCDEWLNGYLQEYFGKRGGRGGGRGRGRRGGRRGRGRGRRGP